jgi:hypothetical protein
MAWDRKCLHAGDVTVSSPSRHEVIRRIFNELVGVDSEVMREIALGTKPKTAAFYAHELETGW